jgi:hypothetical protein
LPAWYGSAGGETLTFLISMVLSGIACTNTPPHVAVVVPWARTFPSKVSV